MKDILGKEFDVGDLFFYNNCMGDIRLGRLTKYIRTRRGNETKETFICQINGYNSTASFTRLDRAVIVTKAEAIRLHPEDYRAITGV